MEPVIADSTGLGRAGSYLLEEELARGGFGVVYRARHEATALPAAVKVLHAGLSADETAIARFEQEAAVVLSLAHPGLCDVLEHGRLADGRPYLAMELLRGETLGEHLAARGRVLVEEALAILEPLAAAIDSAHAHGVVHRDIKPSNVFLAEERRRGRVVLLDFGVARLCDAVGVGLTGSHDTVGTLLYIAPEQLVGSRVDARADVYALAALAYAMLTGRPPFGGNPGRALRQIRMSSRPAAPSSAVPIDPALDTPILRALERDPDRRPRSAGDFVASLRAAARDREPRPRPTGAPPRATARIALAVWAEAHPAAAPGEVDEASFAEMEAALPLVSAELAEAGLVPVVETATRLLLVDPASATPARARRTLDAAARAYRRFAARNGGVDLGIAVHAGELVVSLEGTLLDVGLLDVGSWAPAVRSGVAASVAALAGVDEHEREAPVRGAPGFFWIVRGG